MATIHLRNLKKTKAIPAWIIALWQPIVKPILKGTWKLIEHLANVDFIIQQWHKLPKLKMPFEHSSLYATLAGFAWLTVIALWPERKQRKRDKEPLDAPLNTRIDDLARELVAFLVQQGPEPTIEKLGNEGFFAETAKRIPITHSGYMRRFHPRVESLIYEAGELGVSNFGLNEEVNRDAHSSLNVRAIAAKLKELSAAVASHQQPLQAIGDNDPVIVPEFIDKPMPFPATQHFQGERPLTLQNRGKSDAYNVKICDIVLIEGTASFPEVPFIPQGGEKKVRAKIAGSKGELFGVHDLELLLETEWTYQRDTNLSGFDTFVSILYADKTGTMEFVTDFTMKFDRQLTTAINIKHGKRPKRRLA